jgi:hypothetical protein
LEEKGQIGGKISEVVLPTELSFFAETEKVKLLLFLEEKKCFYFMAKNIGCCCCL